MDMADCSGEPFRLLLVSAERLSEEAIRRGSSQVNTPASRSRALLVVVTRCDQRRVFLEVAIPHLRQFSAHCARLGALLEHAAVDEMIGNEPTGISKKAHIRELDRRP